MLKKLQKLITCKNKVVNKDLEKLNMEFSEDKGTLLDNQCFIWGVTSRDNLIEGEANLYTLNDLSLIYDRETNEFCLDIETIYRFSSQEHIKSYLKMLLNKMQKFLEERKFSVDERLIFEFSNCQIPLRASTISQVYAQFRVFVNGIFYEEANLD